MVHGMIYRTKIIYYIYIFRYISNIEVQKKLNTMNNSIIINCKYFSVDFFSVLGFQFVSANFQHQAQQQPQLATFYLIPIDRYRHRYNIIDLSINSWVYNDFSSVLCKKFKNFALCIAYFSVRRLNISRICSNCTIYSDYSLGLCWRRNE